MLRLLFGIYAIGLLPALAASLVIQTAPLNFFYQRGGTVPISQSVQIQSAGGTLLFSATAASTLDWLRLGTSSGVTPGFISVGVDPTGLDPGTYQGFLTISAQGASNNPQLLQVNLIVLAGSTLSVTPTSLSFNYRIGAVPPPSQDLSITSSAAALDIIATASSNGNWLSVTPTATTPATLQVKVNPLGLNTGAYVGTVTIGATSAVNGPILVSVNLNVSPIQTLLVATTPIVFSFENAATLPLAKTLVIGANTSAIGFTAAPLAGAPWLTVNPTAATAPAQIEIRANPAGLAAGNYSSSIVITSFGISNSPVVVPVTMAITSNLPSVTIGGVLNSASSTPEIAPGSLFSIYGTQLATSIAGSFGVSLPTTAGGVTVEVNGIAIPLVYVSETQINAQMPYEIPPGDATLIVINSSLRSKPTVIPVQPTAPAIFLIAGSTRAIVQNQDFSLNGPTNPARVSTYITMYLTGQGALDNPVASGTVAPAAPFSLPKANVAVTIGGAPANLYFAGLSPGLIGVFQINAEIPELTAGEKAISVKVGGATSNTATLFVAR